MLDAATIAIRLRSAMESSQVSSAELARACGVSPQAVYEWRDTGRIAKRHLECIARALRQPVSYFLQDAPALVRENGMGALRYALHSAFPELTDTDISQVLSYALGMAQARRQKSQG